MDNKQLLNTFVGENSHPVDAWRTATPELTTRLFVASAVHQKAALRRAKVGEGLAFAAWMAVIVLAGVTGTFAFVASAFLGAVVSFTFGVSVWSLSSLPARILERELKPLEGDECHEAVKLLQWPTVAAYRDEVVASGRQLLNGDLVSMRVLAARAESEHRKATAHEACRKAHGLFDVPISPVH